MTFKEFMSAMFWLVVVIGIMYFVYILLVPMGILSRKVDRAILTNSNQYIETQKSGIQNLNIEYEKAQSDDHKKAILIEMCDLAQKIPQNELSGSILSKVRNCL